MTDRELMQQALDWYMAHGEVVFAIGGMGAVSSMNSISEALRTRLSQPEQEPVAWCYKTSTGDLFGFTTDILHDEEPASNLVPLYTAPPQQLRRLHEVNAELAEALYNLRWAASERDKKNRIRQFDDFMDAADAALAKAQGENNVQQ